MNLDHYLYDQFCHPIRQSHFSIGLKAFEKAFNPREEVNEHFLARINILRCLRDLQLESSASIKEITYYEEDTDSGKNDFCG